MAQRDNLYRRQSGTYVLRIVIPLRLRAHLGQSELHASTGTSHLRAAKAIACRLLSEWHSCVEELDHMNLEKLSLSCEVLKIPGLISFSDLSEICGLTVEHLLKDALTHNIPLAYAAVDQPGYLVNDYRDVDREKSGGFVLNDAFEIGSEHIFTAMLKPFNKQETIIRLLSGGVSEEVVFKIPNGNSAAFFDLPGLRLTPALVLISKVQAQKLIIAPLANRLELISATTIPQPAPAKPLNGVGNIDSCCMPKYALMTVSELLEAYSNYNTKEWRIETRNRIYSMVGLFIALTCNPTLNLLERDLIRKYHQDLRNMPKNRALAARKNSTSDPATLITITVENNEERMTELSISRHIEKLSELFEWAVVQKYLKENPAKGIKTPTRNFKREQDLREKFNDEDLAKIFSREWFANGTVEKNKHGRFTGYRPFHYWLPLLGLYSGARVNELAQLYLDEFHITHHGIPYISMEFKDTVKVNPNSDRSLKTENAERKIPLHQHLIELGLMDYVEALREHGHKRLFPELKANDIKGYGKPAGAWFNSELLGNQLNIARTGKKAFHSFRHGFITECYRLGYAPDVTAQFAGQERGDRVSSRTYRKDIEPDDALPLINALSFNLPPIHPFNIEDGLIAIKSALLRKREK